MTNTMWGGRFANSPSDIMEDINASIDFDKRLWPHDIEASKAHVAMLEATKVPPGGNAVDFILAGETAIDGRLPTGTDGGRFGFGSTSSSNVSDAIYEAVIQMRKEAGERQLPKADAGVIIGMQGPMASSAAIVLRRL